MSKKGSPPIPRPHRQIPRRPFLLLDPLEPRLLYSRTFYVDPNSPGPTRDALSWATAYTDLQQALSQAAAGDIVKVAHGTYKPTTSADRSATFNLNHDVILLGGHAGYGAPDPDARDFTNTPSILSGDIGAPNDPSDNSYHVLTANTVSDFEGPDSTLDGFTITAGNADGAAGNDALGAGLLVAIQVPPLPGDSIAPVYVGNTAFTGNTAAAGGAVCALSAASFVNCAFSDNAAGASPGGGAVYAQGSASFNACSLTDNTAAGAGGAVYGSGSTLTFLSSTLSHNTSATAGGAVYTARGASFTACTLSRNNAVAVYAAAFATLTASASTFDHNPAGAVRILAGATGINPLTLDRCTFYANPVAAVDSAVASLVTNSLFVGNDLGIVHASPRSPIINTLIDNDSFYASPLSISGSGAPVVSNSVLWGSATPITSSNPGLAVRYSDVQNAFAGAANLNADPLFARNPSPGAGNAWTAPDADFGDLHPTDLSPLIDAGNTADAQFNARTDFAAHTRIIDFPAVNDPAGAVPDLGAYERGQSVSFTGTPGDDAFYLRLSTASPATLQLFAGTSPTGSPLAAWPLNSLESFTLSTGDGDDSLTLDDSKAIALPFAATLDLGPGDNTITLLNTQTSDRVTATRSSLTFDSSKPAQPFAAFAITGPVSYRLDTTSGPSYPFQSLTLDADLALPQGANRTLYVFSLSLSPSASLDLADNDLLFDYYTPDGGSPYAAVRDLLAEPATHAWAGPGITSSTARARANHQFPGPLTTLAISEFATYSARYNNTHQFDGIVVDNGDAILLKYTYAADATLDGQVNDTDIDTLYAHYQDSRRPQNYTPFYTNRQFTEADFTYDGLVNDRDLDLLSLSYDPVAPIL